VYCLYVHISLLKSECVERWFVQKVEFRVETQNCGGKANMSKIMQMLRIFVCNIDFILGISYENSYACPF
jgi:hypothetical protein